MEADEVRARFTASFPEIEVARLERLGSGWESEAWLADGQLVIRFNLTPLGPSQILKEARVLPALAPGLPVAVPQPRYVATDETGKELSFSAYDYIAGEPLNSQISGTIAERLAKEVAGFLTALHAFDLDEARRLLGDYDPVAGSPWLLRDSWRVEIFPIFEAEERVAIEDRWDHFMAGMDPPDELALIHADLGPEHVLVDAETGALNGVIDWGDVTIGDPALDFAGFEPALRRRVLAAYGGVVDGTFLNRVEFYRWLRPLHEIHYGLYWGGGRQAVDRGTRELMDSLGLP